MGAPTYSILAEIQIYTQYMEHKQLHPILLKHQILGYYRCVDAIFIIYNQKKANIDENVAEFSKQRTNTKFTIEKEHSSINIMDLTIHHKNNIVIRDV
jgi:hypothetical protein